MKINHIGMVVSDLEKSEAFYRDNFGYSVKVKTLHVQNQDVIITMLSNPLGGADIELITPVSEKSPSQNALRKRLVLNHICYETKKYDELLIKYNAKIVRPSMPAPVELFGGGRTFFAYLDGALFEFLELLNE